jgi:hypothetical protein
MKIIEVYISNQSLTGSPIYKKFFIPMDGNKDNTLTAKDLADNDIVFCAYGHDHFNVLKNKFGPIGIMSRDLFKEFSLYSDEEKFINEEMPYLDEVLSSI